MTMHVVLRSPSLCSTLSLQQGELETRKIELPGVSIWAGPGGKSAAQTPVSTGGAGGQSGHKGRDGERVQAERNVEMPGTVTPCT